MTLKWTDVLSTIKISLAHNNFGALQKDFGLTNENHQENDKNTFKQFSFSGISFTKSYDTFSSYQKAKNNRNGQTFVLIRVRETHCSNYTQPNCAY